MKTLQKLTTGFLFFLSFISGTSTHTHTHINKPTHRSLTFVHLNHLLI
uniref:Uncharacterized protein n=1 Tax=Populus trichocarpa TaxID=3694 RepID=A0A3N7EH02_POPTR